MNHATCIQSVKHTDTFNWLLGADWQKIQASVPAGEKFCAHLRTVTTGLTK